MLVSGFNAFGIRIAIAGISERVFLRLELCTDDSNLQSVRIRKSTAPDVVGRCADRAQPADRRASAFLGRTRGVRELRPVSRLHSASPNGSNHFSGVALLRRSLQPEDGEATAGVVDLARPIARHRYGNR